MMLKESEPSALKEAVLNLSFIYDSPVALSFSEDLLLILFAYYNISLLPLVVKFHGYLYLAI